jgi:N-acetylmuramoyl-L-alanine amidase
MRITRREIRQRQTILRDVYYENLRILGKRNAGRARGFGIPKGRVVFFMLTITLILFSLNANLNPKVPIIVQAGIGIEDYALEIFPSEYASFISNSPMPIKKMFGLEVKTIIIDAGHGGEDPGAIGSSGTKEKDITLDIAKMLSGRLKRQANFNVLMTRQTDKTLSLKKRIEIANTNKADLFISIHVNSLPTRPIDIIETYYFGPSSDDNTLKIAAKENEGSSISFSDYSEVIQKIGSTLKLQESKILATKIQRILYTNMKTQKKDVLDFGVKRAPFIVLLGVDMPGVLAEVACLSNREEERKLNDASHREDIARYLEIGIIKYLSARSDT